MHKYCRAYRLGDLRRFNGWVERRDENEPELSNDHICYLWDDFIVVKSPVQDKEVLFDAVTAQWREFCVTTLKFDVPEDLRSVYHQLARKDINY